MITKIARMQDVPGTSIVLGKDVLLPQGVATGQVSDGFHSFDELYTFRKLYNAALFNEWAKQGLYTVHKSKFHNDGKACFGGGWFVVVAVLPTGQVSNHYKLEDWDLFKIPATKKATVKFDGHTGADVIARMHAFISKETTK